MTAAASVGVKRPNSIPEIIRIGAKSAGKAGNRLEISSRNVGHLSARGILVTMAMIAAVSISRTIQTKAGTMPASKS